MNKVYGFLVIISLLLLSGLAGSAAEYKVLRVPDGDTVYLDFNRNGKADANERVRLNGIDAFEVHAGTHLDWQMKTYDLTYKQALTLGYLGREFAKCELLNKFVNAEYTAEDRYDKYGRPIMSLTYDNGKSFEVEILKAGLATVYSYSNLADELNKYERLRKIKRHAKRADKYNLMFYDYKNSIYYPINSDEAMDTKNVLIKYSKKK